MEEAADDRERNVRRKEMNGEERRGEERRKADRKGGDRWERVREKKTWHQTGGEHWSDAERLQESRRRTPVAPELFEMPFHILLKTFLISFLFTPSQLPSSGIHTRHARVRTRRTGTYPECISGGDQGAVPVF